MLFDVEDLLGARWRPMPVKKLTILTADDDSQLLRLVTRNLQLEGYDVVPVSDGQQALDQIEAQKFDLGYSRHHDAQAGWLYGL